MKKSVLRILALIMALSLVAAFAACGNKDEEQKETTTFSEDGLFDDVNAEPSESESESAIEDASAEATTLAEEASSDTAAVSEATDVSAEAATTTEPTAGLTSTDAAEVVAFYNAAVKKTNNGKAPAGQSTMKLDGEITGDGAIGAILKVLSPAAERALSKNSTPTDYIPGKGELKASDATRVQAASKNGVTTITIMLKEQTDGSDADSKTGPVGRGIGTLGSIDGALKELGAELVSGRDTVKLTYNNAYIKCTINEKTGLITGGTWHYTVNVKVGDAQAKLGIKANLKNLKAKIDYQVAI